MKKHLCYLLTGCLVFICAGASAQHDSSYIDLGRTKIRKDFAQTVTIKGRELEHMPFARISDALAPYFNGILNFRNNTVFVVDGNFVNDVDAYSIYDIEEITLVQNALTQVNGSVDAGILVLVTTKRKQGANKGITIAGNTSLVNQKTDGIYDGSKSRTNLYHQYHVGAWKNWRTVQFGLSANFLRDVMPVQKSDFVKVNEPTQLKRFRFNGWVNIDLAPGHSLTARMNFVPQTTSQDYSMPSGNFITAIDLKSKQTLLNPSLRLSNRINKEFLHELDASYLDAREPMDGTTINTIILSPSSVEIVTNVYENLKKNSNFLLRDRISYSKTAGNWQIEPAINFTYRSIKMQQDGSLVRYVDGQLNSITTNKSTIKAESFVLTPTWNFSYRNVFNIGGGVAIKLNRDRTLDSNRIFPFVHTTVDLLRLKRFDNPYSLKIFGSYAKAASFAGGSYVQQDLINEIDPSFLVPIFGPGILLPSAYPQDRKYDNFQLGAVFSLPGDKLQLSYNFDHRQYVGRIWTPISNGTGYDYIMQYPDMTYTAHRVGILAKAFNKPGLQWNTGINATFFKFKVEKDLQFPGWFGGPDRNDDKMMISGGWTNRLAYKKFSLGLDIVYVLNEYRQVPTSPVNGPYTKHNSLRVNNVFVGYSAKAGNKPLEIFLSSRNCLQSDDAIFTDLRQYFGAGFKLQF